MISDWRFVDRKGGAVGPNRRLVAWRGGRRFTGERVDEWIDGLVMDEWGRSVVGGCVGDRLVKVDEVDRWMLDW